MQVIYNDQSRSSGHLERVEGADEREDHTGHEEIWGMMYAFSVLIVVMALQVHICVKI